MGFDIRIIEFSKDGAFRDVNGFYISYNWGGYIDHSNYFSDIWYVRDILDRPSSYVQTSLVGAIAELDRHDLEE